MTDVSPDNPMSYVLWPTGAAFIVAILYRRGLLSRDSLESRPTPVVPLAAIDLLPVGALWIVGAICGSLLAQSFNVTGAPATTQPITQSGPSPRDPALIQHLLMVALQIVIQLPMILFVFWVLLTRTDEPIPADSPVEPRPPRARIIDGLKAFGMIPNGSISIFQLIKMGLIALVAALPIVIGVNQLSVGIGVLLGYRAPDVGHKLLDQFSSAPSPLAIAVLLASVSFLAPILEEFVYRGLLQSCLRPIGSRWQTVIVASAIFASMHIAVVPIQVVPGLFALGLMLGWLYERTGSLWPGMILHCGFNLSNVVLYYLITTNAPTTQPTL